LSQRVSWLLCETAAGWSSAERLKIAGFHNKYFDQDYIYQSISTCTAQILDKAKKEQI